jgi:sigma-B regulation protein RsbU (phosphoserine phosphatase)
LLSHLAEREFEKKTLGHETLERYKEINLLYTVSAKMASCLDPQEVAQLVIEEVKKIIQSTGVSVMLLNEESNTFEILWAYGKEYRHKTVLKPGEGIAGHVFVTGKGTLLNDVQSSPDFVKGENQISSLICVPLKVEEKILGVMNISNEVPTMYAAGDLKLVSALASQAAISIENARLQVERLERERIVQELEIARNIQQSLLPDNIPVVEGVEIAAMSLPAKEVGGDFYDFFFSDEQHLWFVIGDVSDKGIPAALFMSATKTLIKAIAMCAPLIQDSLSPLPPEPDNVLTAVNQELSLKNDSCMFATVFCGVLNVHTGEVLYTNAGHNPPLLLRQGKHAEFITGNACTIIGVDEDVSFTTTTLTLHPGETLLLYTDGVTEAFNTNKELFSEERLQANVSRYQGTSVEELVNTVLQEVRTFSAEMPQTDDVTLLALTYLQ